MGKSEINPVLVSESDSDSDCPDDTVEDAGREEDQEMPEHTETVTSEKESSSRGRTRRKSMVMMMAPWAPMPYLRRAWTPEPKRKSASRQYKRSQSVPEPSCSTAIPAEPADCESCKKNTADQKASKKAMRRWARWQMFMKYLADEMCADANSSSPDDSAASCNEKSDCRDRKVHFTDDEVNSDNNLTWDDDPHCTMLPVKENDRTDMPCVMVEAHPSAVQKVEGEMQQAATDDEELQEKKDLFRQMVKNIGLHPWMLKVLANHGVQEVKEADAKALDKAPADDKETTQKKRQHFRQMIRKLGPSPWMVVALMDEAEAKVDSSSGEQKTVAEKKPNERRIQFRRLVRKLEPAPWMLRVLANNGVPNATKADASVFNKQAAAMTDEKRKVLRTAIKEIGPKAWMLNVVVNQAKAVSKEQERKNSTSVMAVKDTSDENETTSEVDTSQAPKSKEDEPEASICGIKDDEEFQKKKEVFRQTLRNVGLGPWMLTVLANHGVKEAKEIDPKALNKTPAEDKEITQRKRQHFRQMIRKLGPCCWMVMVLKDEAKIDDSSEMESKEEKRPNEERVKFCELVKKLGPAPWMLRVLANDGVPKAREADAEVFGEQTTDNEITDEKQKKLRTTIKEMGPKPWMLDVVINQAKAASQKWKRKNSIPSVVIKGVSDAHQKKFKVSTSVMPTGEGEELQASICGIKDDEELQKKKEVFRQMLRNVGLGPWMLTVLANHGVKEAKEIDPKALNKTPAEDKEITQRKRQHFRQMIRKLGPCCWMVTVLKDEAKIDGSSEQNKGGVEKPNEERMNFRQLVRKLGPAPWMLRVLANNGVPEARGADTTIFNKQTAGNGMTDEKRKELRTTIKEMRPKPWMLDVIINQAKAMSKTENQAKDERKLFREMVIRMSPKPWMFKVLGNNGVPEAKGIKLSEFQFTQEKGECQMQVKRQAFRKMVRSMGPKPWMLEVLINQCTSASQTPGENNGQPDADKNDIQKRREFRQVVRKLKPGSWMIKVLSDNGLQQTAKYPANIPDDNNDKEEKKTEFRQAIEKIGPKPWMIRVVINQANIIAKAEVRKFPASGNTDEEMSESETKAECEKMKRNRKVFAEMVRQMMPKQWMLRVLFNQGLKEAKDVDITNEVGENTDDQDQTKQKRQEFRQYVTSIGPKPWMIKAVVNQARRAAEKKVTEETTDDEKVAETVKSELKNKRREFSFVLKQMKLRPWMVKVLVNNGVAEAEEIDESIFEDRSPFKPAEEQQERVEFRQLIRRIGPKPWMARVLRNQAVIAKTEKANILPEQQQDNPQIQEEKKSKFREMIEEMGAEPWMFKLLTNQMNKTPKQRRDNEQSRIKADAYPPDGDDGPMDEPGEVKKRRKDAQRMMRQMQRGKPWGIPAAPGQQQQNKEKKVTPSAAGSADDSGESEDDLDSEQMSYIYQQMIRHVMFDPEMSSMYNMN